MSKYYEIIERVDEVAPNAFSEKTKFNWLMVLEGKIAADVLQLNIGEIRALPHRYDQNMENEPLISFPHEEMYDLWLRAKIHEGTGEYDHYQNVMQLFNAAYSNFVRWYAHTYQTARGRQHDTHAGWEECDGFFLTAYGLARKQGFRGSLDEWLLSITGPVGPEGRTAYQYAVMQGYNGTEEEFGDLLQQGKTAYQYAKEGGYTGTVEQFRAKMAMEYAALNHDHKGVYAPENHDHAGVYAPENHGHAGVYAPENHNHAGVYAPENHGHAGVYASENHNHDGTYLKKSGGTVSGALKLEGPMVWTEGVNYGTAFTDKFLNEDPIGTVFGILAVSDDG